jgi:uncharacterized phiE125 gp8 family phage protein
MTSYNLSLMEPPTVEPVTLTEALQQCHAEEGVENDWFNSRIMAGRKKVEDYVKRSLVPQTWILYANGSIPSSINLPRSPVREILSVQYSQNHTDGFEEITYEVKLINEFSPSILLLPSSYKTGVLKIKYIAGYKPELIPQPLKDAILLYVSHNYDSRAGEKDFPKAFYDLIEPYRLFENLE